MSRLYRIARRRFCKFPLDGEGSFRFGGRWSSPGVRVVYAAEHLSLAMLEYLVHIDPTDLPHDLVQVTLEVPETVSRLPLGALDLPRNWRQTPAPARLALIGDDWARKCEQAALLLPSALAPIEVNWLLNPVHADFLKISVVSVDRFSYDLRLLAKS